MAKDEKALADYRAERKERIAKAAKKKNKAQADSTKAVRIVIYVVLALAVLGLIVAGLFYFGVPQQFMTAAKVDGKAVSYPEYNYYYTSVYQSLSSQADEQKNSYGFSLFDTSKDPSTQTYETDDDGNVKTYADYIRETVMTTLEQTKYYSSLAKEKGIELNVNKQSEVDDTINSIKSYAETYGYSASRYVSLLYGKGMTLGNFRKFLEQQYLVSQYLEDIEADLSKDVSDDEIEAKFAEAPESYKVTDIRLFGFTVPEEEKPEETTEAATEAAEDTTAEEAETAETADTAETAEAAEATEETTAEESTAEETTVAEKAEPTETELLAKEFESRITDENSFIELAKEYCDEEDRDKFESDTATLVKNLKYSIVNGNISTDLASWLYSEERQTGDTTTCTTDNYIYVIYVITPAYRNEESLVDARHILVSYDAIKSEIEAQAATEVEGIEELETEAAPATEETAEIETENEAGTEKIEIGTKTATDGTEISNKDTGYSIDVVLKTYEKAHEILEEYAKNETEENFAELAEKYSADTGSVGENASTSGGLYENIERGTYVKEFEDWVYDETRQPGDTAIVRTEYGYHIMYFVQKHAEPSWKETVRATIASGKADDFENESKTAYEGKATEGTWFNYANKNALELVNKIYLTKDN